MQLLAWSGRTNGLVIRLLPRTPGSCSRNVSGSDAVRVNAPLRLSDTKLSKSQAISKLVGEAKEAGMAALQTDCTTLSAHERDGVARTGAAEGGTAK